MKVKCNNCKRKFNVKWIKIFPKRILCEFCGAEFKLPERFYKVCNMVFLGSLTFWELVTRDLLEEYIEKVTLYYKSVDFIGLGLLRHFIIIMFSILMAIVINNILLNVYLLFYNIKSNMSRKNKVL